MTATPASDSDATNPHDTRREVLGLDDAAVQAGVSRRTLQRAIHRGDIERIEVEGRAMIEAAALAAWSATRQPDVSRQRDTDSPRHDAEVRPDQGLVAEALRAEVRHLQLRLDYAEKVAAERQRTIDALSVAVANLTSSLATGIAPEPISATSLPGPTEPVVVEQQRPADPAPDAAVTSTEPRSAEEPPRVGVQSLQGASQRPWWKFWSD